MSGQLKDNPIRERLTLFFTKKGYSRLRVTQICGFSTAYLSTLSGDLPDDKLAKIVELFPDLNVEWLRTGKGEMTLSSVRLERFGGDGYEIMNRIDSVLHYYNISQSEFESTHCFPKGSFQFALPSEDVQVIMNWVFLVHQDFPNASLDWILTGEGFMIKPSHEIPLISDLDRPWTDAPKLSLSTSYFDGAQVLYQSLDRDMSPKIRVGDFLICRQTYDSSQAPSSYSFLEKKMLWESRATYVILFESGQVRVKDVVVTDLGELLLYGIGPDGMPVLAHSTSVDSPEIKKAFQVMGLIRQNVE